jgi:tRNA 2-thiouridine synthesizing protein A
LTFEIYDLRGLNCPLPVLRTRKRLAGLASGAVLVVETTDPLASLDIPAFCGQDGHQLVSTETTENGHRFTIVKR